MADDEGQVNGETDEGRREGRITDETDTDMGENNVEAVTEQQQRTEASNVDHQTATTNATEMTTETIQQTIEEITEITEKQTEIEEKQKTETAESGHKESTVVSTEVASVATTDEEQRHQQQKTTVEIGDQQGQEKKEESSLKLDTTVARKGHDENTTEASNKSEKAEVVPERTESRREAEDTGTSEEISEPSVKAELKEIIREIEENIDNGDREKRQTMQQQPEKGEDKHEEDNVEEIVIGEDGQVYHTWYPKGKYELQHTVVEIQEVVPIDVADVPEPEPIHIPETVPAQEQQEEQHQEQGHPKMEAIGIIMVPQLLPNGQLGPLIQIPEGIPLLARVLPRDEDSHREKIPLERLFTPATDSGDITPRKKKAAFASSDFYGPNHPTIDDQLQLAQKISESLGDQNNKRSRGQAMYEKRKQRSEKWIHQAIGSNMMMPLELKQMQQPQNKSALKLVMNPKGVQDHTTVEQHYQQLIEHSTVVGSCNIGSGIGQLPGSPEIAKDIMNDMQSPTGKGAALFAKRKKRMDKFIVDETNVQKTSAYQQQQESSVQNSTMSQSSTNQFSSSSFSSSTSSSSMSSKVQQQKVVAPAAPGSKKKWLQERDQEQQQIMDDFIKSREAPFKMVKSPWESVLETGNTSSAFQQVQQTKRSFSSSVSSTSATGGQEANMPSWLEMPKPVPVMAAPPACEASMPASASPFRVSSEAGAHNAPHQPPPCYGPIANDVGGGATVMYSAEVTVQQAADPGLHNHAGPVSIPAAATLTTKPSVAASAPFVTCPVVTPGVGGTGFGSESEEDIRRKNVNFNLAANGWGSYSKYYRPISFAS